MLAFKSVVQKYSPSPELLGLMESFRLMTSECTETGKGNDVSSPGKLSRLCHAELAKHGTLSYYRPTAMSRAAGILSAGKKSMKRCRITKSPYADRAVAHLINSGAHRRADEKPSGTVECEAQPDSGDRTRNSNRNPAPFQP